MEKVVDDSGSDAKVVDLGATVPVNLPGETGGPEASRYNPHWWHDPRNAEAAVRQIAAQLSQIDPQDKATFEANAKAYLAKLRTLDAGIATCMDTVPPQDRKLVTDHDAFPYFANRYGIDVVGAVIPSQTTQAQPNAQDLSNLADLVRKEHVKAIFPESSLSPKLAQTIAVGNRSYAPTTPSTATPWARRIPPATPISTWRRRMPTRWSRGSPSGSRGCEVSGIG